MKEHGTFLLIAGALAGLVRALRSDNFTYSGLTAAVLGGGFLAYYGGPVLTGFLGGTTANAQSLAGFFLAYFLVTFLDTIHGWLILVDKEVKELITEFFNNVKLLWRKKK